MKRLAAAILLAALAGCTTLRPDPAQARRDVEAAERAFAKTMADRDHAAFTAMLSQDTVFFSGPQPLHGREAVSAYWKKFYETPLAPFSWAPSDVEVLESGDLALTSGPVHNPAGKLVGRFTSIWRREQDGQWRIVFDKGCDVCEACPTR